MLEKLIWECVANLRVDHGQCEDVEILVHESIDYFHNIIGTDFDISKGFERSLVKNRVRYAFNNALEDFSFNFAHHIESLQVKYAKTTLEDL